MTVYRLLEYDIKDCPLDIKSSMLFQMNGIYQYNENKKSPHRSTEQVKHPIEISETQRQNMIPLPHI